MIDVIRGKLAALDLEALKLNTAAVPSGAANGYSFASVLSAETTVLEGRDDAGTEDAGEDSSRITRNSYTGFFKEIQEKRMEELREEILEEMGLTEEMLAKMDPEARGRIEGIIAKEIQKRMMAQSAMDEDGENQGLKKRMLLSEIDLTSLPAG